MGIEADFAELMVDTVTWYPVSSTSEYGARSFASSGTEITCRCQDDMKARSNEQRRMNLPEGTIYCYGYYAVSVQDKIVLPDGSEAEVVRVGQVGDEDGNHHTVIRVGDAQTGRWR